MKKDVELTAYDEWVAARLAKKPKVAAEYMRLLMADAKYMDNSQVLRKALKQIAHAHGMGKVAKASGIRRESLSRALSDRGNPRIDTLFAVMRAMGLRLTVEPHPAPC